MFAHVVLPSPLVLDLRVHGCVIDPEFFVALLLPRSRLQASIPSLRFGATSYKKLPVALNRPCLRSAWRLYSLLKASTSIHRSMSTFVASDPTLL